MNVDRSIESVKHLIYHAATPIFLNLDGHPVQESECVKDCVASTEGGLRLFILPPYSPHLNPDGRVWNSRKLHKIGKARVAGPSQFRTLVDRTFAYPA